jgi:ubiquinone/menaquinone biosynthesis C-methylase UbiE
VGEPLDPFSARAVAAGYDAAVDHYVEAFGEDLARLPLDREVLDTAFAAAGTGWVVEVGCGPGVAALHYGQRAPRVVGVDISAGMLVAARRRSSGLQPVRGDIRALPIRPACAGLVTAWYCLQHVHRSQIATVFSELARVLVPGGVLAIATHLGEGDVTMDEFLGARLTEPVGGTFHARDELLGLLANAGFGVVLERSRGPLPHEHDSERLYVLATNLGPFLPLSGEISRG